MRSNAKIFLILATIHFAFVVVSVECSEPIELNEENWRLMLKGEWMVQFLTPWCASCKNLWPTWVDYAKKAEKFQVKVAYVDVTNSPSLSGRFLVTTLPTIYHVRNGQFRYYLGKRDKVTLNSFIKRKKWQKIKPISSLTHPNSFHMGILSYFFRLSFMLKEMNNSLQDDYGLSAYGSYGLFVLGTIFIGGLLGLIVIVLLDFIWSSKKQKRSFMEIKKLIGLSSFDQVEEKVDIEELQDLEEVETEPDDNFESGDEQTNQEFVISKNIELMPDMYEDESDEDIFHNCKLILPVSSDQKFQ